MGHRIKARTGERHVKGGQKEMTALLLDTHVWLWLTQAI
jgi:hypothetical protein